ncbi:nucleotidyltransferase [Alteribacter natronophilus]|uniref:nucleotidyltransferase n=1 Tax=Alteribacter natronophilus TaxID=2583810 RepID=UPI00148622E7|nr:nucleotidyltransferase [Alteribacter natronophilus]
MKTTGLVVEYNPFHNGHQYHLTESRKLSGADIVIAVMSGPFLQRGEPAITDKWTRTRMALKGGCDIVVELPFAYAVQHASVFARGAVAILEKLGASSVVFGSEDGNTDRFHQTARLLQARYPEYSHHMKKALSDGLSYPAAAASAYRTIASDDFTGVDLSEPNNILGLQYCEAAAELGGRIEPLTITREQAGYHDPVAGDGPIASATSIRRILFSPDSDLEDIRKYVPETTYQCLKEYKEEWGGFHSWEDYFPLFRHRLVTSSPEDLRSICEMEEGLEHRFKKGLSHAEDWETFLSFVKTKRYTRTRLQRAMVHMLMNTGKKWLKDYGDPLKPSYIRLLGMTAAGQEYLSSVRKDLDVPLVANASRGEDPLFEKDIEASTVHHLPLVERAGGSMVKEYRETPVRIKKTGSAFV